MNPNILYTGSINEDDEIVDPRFYHLLNPEPDFFKNFRDFSDNFEELSDALDWCRPKSDEIQRSSRSPYNIFDQIAYQEDAMSGAELKALSVSLDTFCSVCNQVKPQIRDISSVYVI